jgi:type I restriction enzyme R subunit
MTDRRGGIIWHTQGSGKSLTMVFLVKKLRTNPALRRFKVVVVTDRTDLEDQLSTTAKLAGQVMRVASSSDAAKMHLGRQEPDLVFVTIQKIQDRNGRGSEEEIVFAAESHAALEGPGESARPRRLVARIGERTPFPVVNESEDILILIDEAHRSHGSELHQNLLDALPNAARIGFSGTPIEAKDKKKTREIFGSYIDRYLLRDAEADGAIVKILYEGRELRADVTSKTTLDQLFDATFATRSAAEREAIKDRYATRRHVLNAADPLKAKAIDILRHYILNILPNGFKAQLVAASRELAVDYVEALVTARDGIVNAIEATADILRFLDPEATQNAGGDVAFMAAALPYLGAIKRLEFAAVISIDHNDLLHLKAWGGVTETKQRLQRFKKPLAQDPLTILVVKSKLLTGFDAKVEQAMYIDRAISGTELLQAIARTNRTSARQRGSVSSLITMALVPTWPTHWRSTTRKIREIFTTVSASPRNSCPSSARRATPWSSVSQIKMSFENPRSSPTSTPVSPSSKEPKLRAEFLVLLKKLVGLFDTLMPRPEARAFASDVKLYVFIAKAAANLYRDSSLDIRGIAHKVQSLLDAYVLAHGIDPKIPPIEILDPNFAAEVGKKQVIVQKPRKWRMRCGTISPSPLIGTQRNIRRSVKSLRPFWRPTMRIGEPSRSNCSSSSTTQQQRLQTPWCITASTPRQKARCLAYS